MPTLWKTVPQAVSVQPSPGARASALCRWCTCPQSVEQPMWVFKTSHVCSRVWADTGSPQVHVLRLTWVILLVFTRSAVLMCFSWVAWRPPSEPSGVRQGRWGVMRLLPKTRQSGGNVSHWRGPARSTLGSHRSAPECWPCEMLASEGRSLISLFLRSQKPRVVC